MKSQRQLEKQKPGETEIPPPGLPPPHPTLFKDETATHPTNGHSRRDEGGGSTGVPNNHIHTASQKSQNVGFAGEKCRCLSNIFIRRSTGKSPL